jgi:hypothetical protein
VKANKQRWGVDICKKKSKVGTSNKERVSKDVNRSKKMGQQKAKLQKADRKDMILGLYVDSESKDCPGLLTRL